MPLVRGTCRRTGWISREISGCSVDTVRTQLAIPRPSATCGSSTSAQANGRPWVDCKRLAPPGFMELSEFLTLPKSRDRAKVQLPGQIRTETAGCSVESVSTPRERRANSTICGSTTPRRATGRGRADRTWWVARETTEPWVSVAPLRFREHAEAHRTGLMLPGICGCLAETVPSAE